jgi:hypothetical protein
MEKITLATPEVVPQIQTTDYRPVKIHLDREPEARIFVLFYGTNGERREWRVDDAARALTLLKALNTANLSLKSLERRCLEQAIADGVFGNPATAGTVTGVPD